MFFGGPVPQIREIVEQIEGADEEGLMNLTGEARKLLIDLERFASPKRRNDKGHELLPGNSGMKKALPYLKALVSAMQGKDRRRALEIGEEALKELEREP